MLCVVIKDQIVIEGPLDFTEDQIQDKAQINTVISVEGFDPIPKIGWHYVGGKLIDPYLVGNSGVALLSRFAFFNRFTVEEWAALEGFMDVGPSPYKYIARAFKTALMITTYVDRALPTVKDGLGFFVQLGILSSSRRDEILNTPAKASEIFRG